MNFKQYKQKLRGLSKRSNTENWETEEVSRWIMNDEGLYDAAYNAVRRGYMDPVGALQSVVEEYQIPDVDLSLVDWEALVAEIDEDSAEQMGYDASQMLAQDQPGDTYLPEGWTSKVAADQLGLFDEWPTVQNPNDPYLEARHGPWSAQWNGGRLMDVYHDESPTPLDAIEAGHYDWQNSGPFSGSAWHEAPTQEGVNQRLRDWANEYGGDYERNALPYQSSVRKNAATCPNCGGHNALPLMGDFMECRDCGYDWDEDREQYFRDINGAGELYDSIDNLNGLPTRPHPQGQE